MEVDAELGGDRAEVLVVTNDQGDFGGKFVGFPAPEEVEKAVVLFADPDGEAGVIVGEVQFVGGLPRLGDGSEGSGDDLAGEVKVFQEPFHATEKDVGVDVGVVVATEDVAAVGIDEVGDLGDESPLVGAGNEQGGGGVHGFAIVNGSSGLV